MDSLTLAFPDRPVLPGKPWKRLTGGGYTGLTEESLVAFKAAWKEYERASGVWRGECKRVVDAATALLLERGFPNAGSVRLGPSRSRSVTLAQAIEGFNPARSFSPPSLWLSDEEQWLRDTASRECAAQRETETRALRDRAVAWLLARGKRYGEDFTADTALAVALEIAAAEKIIEMRKAAPWHDFTGMNCNDWDDLRECKGWDGESRRCHCGNRRVSWEIDGSFEAPRVYGEAY